VYIELSWRSGRRGKGRTIVMVKVQRRNSGRRPVGHIFTWKGRLASLSRKLEGRDDIKGKSRNALVVGKSLGIRLFRKNNPVGQILTLNIRRAKYESKRARW